MLQRIQSVYLTSVFIFSLLYLIFPLGTIIINGSPFNLKAYELAIPVGIAEEVNIRLLQGVLLIVLFLHMALTVIITLKYKKRLLQMRLNKFNLLLTLILIVLSFFYVDTVKSQLSVAEINYGASMIFPFVSMLLIFLSNKAIRKDENLVRSANRIR